MPHTSVGSAARPVLHAGEQYWIFASTTGLTEAVWFDNNTGASGLTAFRDEGQAWSRPQVTAQTGAFRVLGDAVPAPIPEPATRWLIVGGFAAATRHFRRRMNR